MDGWTAGHESYERVFIKGLLIFFYFHTFFTFFTVMQKQFSNWSQCPSIACVLILDVEGEKQGVTNSKHVKNARIRTYLLKFAIVGVFVKVSITHYSYESLHALKFLTFLN